jgi:hypothetical protein
MFQVVGALLNVNVIVSLFREDEQQYGGGADVRAFQEFCGPT